MWKVKSGIVFNSEFGIIYNAESGFNVKCGIIVRCTKETMINVQIYKNPSQAAP